MKVSHADHDSLKLRSFKEVFMRFSVQILRLMLLFLRKP